ncbi:MAG: PAS domain-containing protein [Christensenellaceae bacterium]|jgi:two-component system phosphate regulon sensor histidine kinase PhoR|nr:PAS domain-containing protein [Christensenellaceae bacterium]
MISLKKRLIASSAAFAALLALLAAFFSLRAALFNADEELLGRIEACAEQLCGREPGEEEMLFAAKATGLRLLAYARDGSPLFDTDGAFAGILGLGLPSPVRAPAVSSVLSPATGREYNPVRAPAVSGEERHSMSPLTGAIWRGKGFMLPDGRLLWVIGQSEAYTPRVFPFLLLFIALCGLFCCAFILALNLAVLRPILALERYALHASAGDAEAGTPFLHAPAEIQSLVRTVEGMKGALGKAIETLERQNAEMEEIFDSMQSGLVAVDDDLRIVRINRRARQMLGISGLALGKSLLEASGNARLESVLLEEMQRGGEIAGEPAELPVRANPGHRLLRIYSSALRHGSEKVGAVALLEDITQLRNLEQMRTDFAANVTHELKTPLTSIQGFVETLQAGAVNDPDAAQYFLKIIADESDRLSRLISDILSLSSMESGRVRVPMKRLSLGQYAAEACDFLRGAAKRKDISLTISEGEESFVQGNEDHLKQILINLVENAIKYTLNGGKVDVGVSREGDEVVLRVKDTGIGIEKEHIPRLFERFYRVDKGRSRSMGGTGLGLAIVKHLTLEMNGSIEVESEPGKGSEFIVRLPRDKGEGEKA